MHLLSANLLIQIAGFGGQIFLTRILSVEDIGTIKILQSYLNILVILASLGLNTAVLKLCSEDIKKEQQLAIFNISFFFTTLISIVIIVVITFILTFTSLNVDKLLSVYILLIPFLSLTNLIISYLQSQQKIKTISLVQSYSKIFIVVFSTIIAYVSGLNGYIISLVILNAIVFLVTLYYIKNDLKPKTLLKDKLFYMRKLMNIGTFALGANLLTVLLANFNIIIGNHITNDVREIGYYSIAQLIITTMMIIPSTLGQIMVPKISKVSKNLDEVLKIFKIYHKRNTILAVSVAVLAGISAPYIIPFVFGEEYKNSVYYFEILLLGFVFWSIFSPKGITLMSLGRSDINFYVSLISVVINITLNYILILHYGMYGAATANTITYLINIFVNNYFFKYLTKKGSAQQ